MRNKIISSLIVLIFLNACGSSSSEQKQNEKSKKEFNVTVERGPVFNAYIEDANGNIATNNNSNIYTFSKEIKYPLTVKVKKGFNTFIDLDNDKVFSKNDKILDTQMKSYSNIITPISTYIANKVENSLSNKELKEKIEEEYKILSNRLNISNEELNNIPSNMKNKDSILLTNSIYFLIKEKKELNNINITDIENKVSQIKDLVKDFKNNIDLEKKLFEINDLEEKKVIDESKDNDENIEIIKPIIKDEEKIEEIKIPPVVKLIDSKILNAEIYPSNDYILKSKNAYEKVDKTTIMFKNLEYKIITSPITGKKWLDRNLGASKVCTDYKKEDQWHTEYRDDQKDCFGDYYQWGRLDDGHEKLDSSVTQTKSETLNVNNEGKFIITNLKPGRKGMDWVKTSEVNEKKREEFWSGVNNVSICPVGFKVPTGDELMQETHSFQNNEDIDSGIVKIKDAKTAFEHFLKLPTSASKVFTSEISHFTRGSYWTSDYAREDAWNFSFPYTGSLLRTIQRANASTIRCIENENAIITQDTLDEEVYPSQEYIDNIKDIKVDKNTILFNNLTYKIITSPITGKKWLDRNLGASKVCDGYNKDLNVNESYRKSQGECFGDYYQWGRATDGHEKTRSLTTNKKSQTLNVSNEGKFITAAVIPNDKKNIDWIKTTLINTQKREDFWAGKNDVSICPKGFRVPEGYEFKDETTIFSIKEDISKGIVKATNSESALQNFLKLPTAHYRSVNNEFNDYLDQAQYWTKDHGYESNAWRFSFTDQIANLRTIPRAYALNIRCIKNK